MAHRKGTEGGLPPVALLVAVQATVSAASLVVEIVAGRMLAPYVGMSLYTWTSVIAVVLAGFSAGHWLGGRVAEAPGPRALSLTGWAAIAAAVTTAGAVSLLRWLSAPVLSALAEPALAIAVLAGLVFFLPSFFAGVPAPVLAQIAVVADPARSGRALGAMFAASALGAIAGTLAAGFLFISWLGSVATLAAVTLTYLAVALVCFRAAHRAGRAIGVGGAAVAILASLGLTAEGLSRADPCFAESDYFCIRVLDVSAAGDGSVRLMVIDHLGHGISSRDLPEVMFTDHAAILDTLARARMGDGPFRAFLIGGGSYSLPRAWAEREPAAEVTVAEIDPTVTQVARSQFWFDPSTARILHRDARHALQSAQARYDVIVGDAFTDIAVPAHLVTREFFGLVRARLSEGGVYLMNVIDHTDNMHALASILRTLREVFPVVEVWTEARPSEAGERRVFIVLAGTTPTAQSMFATRSPGPFRFARLSRAWQDELLATHRSLVLTDDYTPIDRLMRWTD